MQDYRKGWFEHVRKTRKKMERSTKKKVLHRDAMTAASKTWPKQKLKLERAAKRAAKKAALVKPVVQESKPKKPVDV